jgi:hypothetical protein
MRPGRLMRVDVSVCTNASQTAGICHSWSGRHYSVCLVNIVRADFMEKQVPIFTPKARVSGQGLGVSAKETGV